MHLSILVLKDWEHELLNDPIIYFVNLILYITPNSAIENRRIIRNFFQKILRKET